MFPSIFHRVSSRDQIDENKVSRKEVEKAKLHARKSSIVSLFAQNRSNMEALTSSHTTGSQMSCPPPSNSYSQYGSGIHSQPPPSPQTYLQGAPPSSAAHPLSSSSSSSQYGSGGYYPPQPYRDGASITNETKERA